MNFAADTIFNVFFKLTDYNTITDRNNGKDANDAKDPMI